MKGLAQCSLLRHEHYPGNDSGSRKTSGPWAPRGAHPGCFRWDEILVLLCRKFSCSWRSLLCVPKV